VSLLVLLLIATKHSSQTCVVYLLCPLKLSILFKINMSSAGVAPGSMEGGLLQNALAIVGIILAFFILLLVLRYGCNIAIDLCILCDPNEARRTSIEFRDRYFPCLKRRQVVPDVEETSPSANTSSAEAALASALRGGDGASRRQPVTLEVDALLKTLSGQERQDVLNVLLKGKKVRNSIF
jgi:hypothetical protein